MLEADNSGGAGIYYQVGEHIDPGDEAEYEYLHGRVLSLLASVEVNGTTFVYDGDGNRIRKTENGQTILYINKYYEVNLTTGNATSYYYLGGRLVAMSENTTLRYIHQDHLTGTSLVTSDNGTSLGTMKYYPYGA